MNKLLDELLKQKAIIEEHIECIHSFYPETQEEFDEQFAAMDRFAEFLADTQNTGK